MSWRSLRLPVEIRTLGFCLAKTSAALLFLAMLRLRLLLFYNDASLIYILYRFEVSLLW